MSTSMTPVDGGLGTAEASPTRPASPASPVSPVSPAGPASPASPASPEPPAGRGRRPPVWAWLLIAAVVVLTLILLGVGQVVRALDVNADDDPRSTRAGGTAALAQLLRDEGVDLTTTRDARAATGAVGPDATVVIIDPARLTDQRWRALVAARPARIVLIAPTTGDLLRAGVTGVERVSDTSQPLDPGCADPAATRSGTIFPTLTPAYTLSDGASGCYTADGASALVLTQVDGVALTILPSVVSNETLAVEGNAALAMNTLGQRPRLVWLMATAESTTGSGGNLDRPTGPNLLPGWWPMLLLQLLVALVAVGLWRGRRLGPILYEQLPVRITSAETIEGHGRLYQRQQARGAAAAALRAAAIRRLAARHGHLDDPQALAEVLSTRTGRPPLATRLLLTGPEPASDEQLLDLKIDLDTLEQEAHHP